MWYTMASFSTKNSITHGASDIASTYLYIRSERVSIHTVAITASFIYPYGWLGMMQKYSSAKYVIYISDAIILIWLLLFRLSKATSAQIRTNCV